MVRARLLIVDDEPNILATVRRMLELEGYGVDVAGSGRIALEKLEAREFDGVLLDVAMADLDGLSTLKALRQESAALPVVMMSGHATLQTAVEATKLGANDFLEKPLTVEKLLITLQNVLKLSALERDARAVKERAKKEFAMIGKSPRMQRVFEVLRRAAPSDGRVLIGGERGTGKELIARALHQNSKRAEAPFVKVNCAAIPSELIESELFGHEKGAFTGATRERRGKFEQAHLGTLFLDEIGDMNASAQAKVLRVLQEGEIERVGGDETLSVDVRVIAATNKDLQAECGAGRFRADLYDRLNVVPLEAPPLRDRKEDIPLLVEHFLEELSERGRRLTVDEAALGLLMQYHFPGNVRELRNLVERLTILAPNLAISADAVRDALPDVQSVRASYQRGVALKDLVASAEREIVLAALEAHEFHIAKTARELGLERSHLYKKMRALGIQSKREENEEE